MKRTDRLEQEKEVFLFETPEGPVWTTAGQLKLSGDEEAEKRDKQKKAIQRGNIQEVVQALRQTVNNLLERLICQIAPMSVLTMGEQAVERWMMEENISIRRDELKWVVKRGPNIVAEIPLSVPASMKSAVLAMMKEDEA